MSKKDDAGTPVNNAATEAFGKLDAQTKSYLLKMIEACKTSQEAVRLALVGDCPSCGSQQTIDGENLPVSDNCVGICLSCGYTWCLECGNPLEKVGDSCSCFYG